MGEFFRLIKANRQTIFCPLILVADTYSGCPHSCNYCYGPRATFLPALPDPKRPARRLFTQPKVKFKNAYKEVKRIIDRAFRTPEKSPLFQAIAQKFPVRIGSVSEPFQIGLEKKYKHTYEILEALGEYQYPYILCTKSPLVAEPEYINLIKKTGGIVQISLISLNEELLRCLESNAPPPQERLGAFENLVSEGIWTTCRIQPLIPGVTDEGMPDLIDKLASIGVNHVIIEFMKLIYGEMRDRMKVALEKCSKRGIKLNPDLVNAECDIFTYYKNFPDVQIRDGFIFFSKRGKARLMPQFVKMIKEANQRYNRKDGNLMTFGSGDEETQYLNFTRNCCGLDRVPGFSGYSTCTIQTMLRIAKEKGKVTLENMKHYYNPNMSKFEELWRKKDKNRHYFIENRVFKLRGIPTDDPSEVEYVYDEKAVPSWG